MTENSAKYKSYYKEIKKDFIWANYMSLLPIFLVKMRSQTPTVRFFSKCYCFMLNLATLMKFLPVLDRSVDASQSNILAKFHIFLLERETLLAVPNTSY